ncbi:gastrin-releasing peptide [Scomber scombrus]|nr:gastrin-releasing peptide [Scomber scombrus]
MGGVCLCWTCRPVWPLFLILASLPRMLHCSESPAAIVGKIYPRGNHWAVGHLMGKKSIEDLPVLQDSNQDSDYLTPSETAGVTQLDRYKHLMEALLQLKNQKRMMPQTAQRLLWLHSGWREEDKD